MTCAGTMPVGGASGGGRKIIRLELSSGALIDEEEECNAILQPDEVLNAICTAITPAPEGGAAATAAAARQDVDEDLLRQGAEVVVEGGKYDGQTGTVRSVAASTCRLTITDGKRTGKRTGNIKKVQLTVQVSDAGAAVARSGADGTAGGIINGYGALPEEVLLMIFNSLDHYEDVTRVRSVCAGWRNAVPLCRLLQHLQITMDTMAPREVVSKTNKDTTVYVCSSSVREREMDRGGGVESAHARGRARARL